MSFAYLYIMNDELFDAIRVKDLEKVSKIITAHPELVNIKDERGSTPLLLATYYGAFDIASEILKHNSDINAQDISGNTALMGVCFKGYPDIAELLITNGADVNAVNFNKASALIYAATFSQEDIVKLLLKYNVDTSHKDSKGNTAFDHAKMQGSKVLMAILENS